MKDKPVETAAPEVAAPVTANVQPVAKQYIVNRLIGRSLTTAGPQSAMMAQIAAGEQPVLLGTPGQQLLVAPQEVAETVANKN